MRYYDNDSFGNRYHGLYKDPPRGERGEVRASPPLRSFAPKNLELRFYKGSGLYDHFTVSDRNRH